MTDGNGTGEAVVIERTFDVPVERIWELWTQPEHFKAWYGPAGATIPVAEFDLRVGGTRRVCMEVPTPSGGRAMWFVGAHVEIDEPSRLVYTETMTDADGNPIAPSALGMPADHPPTTEVRVELTAANGRTTMRLTHLGIAVDSPGAAGWAMALDKLALVVAAATPPNPAPAR